MAFISSISRFIKSTSRVTPEVIQITILGANIWLIAEEELTIIDTGFRGSASQIIEAIRKIGRTPEEIARIIITHNHIDHAGGLRELKKYTSATVAVHREDIGERKNLPSACAEDVDMPLEGGEVFSPLGGLEVVHTPGHTLGSICLLSRSTGILFSGDALRKQRHALYLPPAKVSYDLDMARESARKISNLEFSTLCFGHGLPLTEDIHQRIQDLLNRDED